MTYLNATTVRFTPEQTTWLRKRAFELNLPQQFIVEDALVALGMPRGESVRPGEQVSSLPLPDGVKDYYDRNGNLWARASAGRWNRFPKGGDMIRPDLHSVSGQTMLKEHGPLTVGKLKGQ
jgi:hypothetical protein